MNPREIRRARDALGVISHPNFSLAVLACTGLALPVAGFGVSRKLSIGTGRDLVGLGSRALKREADDPQTWSR